MTLPKPIWPSIALFLMASVAAQAADPPSPQARLDTAIASAKNAMWTDPQEVVMRADQAAVLVSSLHEPRARFTGDATLLWLKSEALYRLDAVKEAAPIADRALVLSRKAAPDTKLEADILLTRGSINAKQGDVSAALTDLQQAHRIFVSVKDPRKEAISLICLAMLYVDGRDYRTAIHYLDEALDAFPADPGLAISIYNSRGVALQNMGDYSQASAAFGQALRFARQIGSPVVEAQYLRNIARNYLLAGQLADADRAIMAARDIAGTGGADGRQLDAVAAQAALQHGRTAEAARLIDRAFAGVDLTRTDLSLRDAHQTAVSVYQARHRDDLALVHLQALKRLDDQATQLATQTSTALMAARFNSANQDAKIVQLRDAERLRQAREEVQRARSERTLWLGASGATAIIIILLLLGITTVRRSRDKVSAANDDLAVTNTALGKALAAKTEFLATTSHEIRTPLNGILGMTQVMLADATLTPTTRDRLTVVHGAGVTMRTLVDDILDAAKMETGNLGLETAPFDLRAMLTDASRIWSEQARDKGLIFSLNLDRCPARIEGDAARVRQIASNLLSNALKFTARGSVSLRAEETPEGISLVVSDTGIGIAPEQHEAVFESFRQADTSTTRQFGGTGLGLSIVRNLARAMGGEITLASAPGEGSSFTVLLPLPILAAPAEQDVAPRGDTLLVVDRNPIARAMLRTLFAPHVATVAFAGTADEVAAALAGGGITRIVIDDVTARAGGDPHGFVATAVRAARGAPVTLLWAMATEADGDELTALGAENIIAKPITGMALVKALFDQDETQRAQTPLVSQAA